MAGLDVPAATLECAARLRELGLTDWSQKVADAVHAAATGGELVMGVRWHLQQLERSGEELPEDLRHLIRDIVQAIDRTGW